MERYRRKKLIIIIALILTISGLSIGFAAFTSVLTISSTATVKPDESSFSVLFSSSGTSQATAQITPTVVGATGDKATISGTTISGLKANFTEAGQSVTYKFWSHNAGSYIAYLRNITYQNAVGESSFKKCTPGTGTTASLVTAACEDISVTVSVGSTNASDTVGVTNHPLGINAYEQVIVTITYAANGDLADGPFDIKFGDITLNYGSVDGNGEVYTVSYDSSITNNGYPSTVSSGSDLQVTFTEPIPSSVKLYVDGVEVDSSLYAYEDGILIYPNVLGNVVISSVKSINDLNLNLELRFNFIYNNDIMQEVTSGEFGDAYLKMRIYHNTIASDDNQYITYDGEIKSTGCSGCWKSGNYRKVVVYDSNNLYEGEYVVLGWTLMDGVPEK